MGILKERRQLLLPCSWFWTDCLRDGVEQATLGLHCQTFFITDFEYNSESCIHKYLDDTPAGRKVTEEQPPFEHLQG